MNKDVVVVALDLVVIYTVLTYNLVRFNSVWDHSTYAHSIDILYTQLVGAAFGAAGQRCMALSTAIFVGEAKEWVPELVERAKKLKVNAGEYKPTVWLYASHTKSQCLYFTQPAYVRMYLCMCGTYKICLY